MLQFSDLQEPGVAELADALDSKSSGTWYRVGSTPSSGTTFLLITKRFCIYLAAVSLLSLVRYARSIPRLTG